MLAGFGGGGGVSVLVVGSAEGAEVHSVIAEPGLARNLAIKTLPDDASALN